ncbi:extracellular glycoprotein lacritin isoform X1 [Desmodus rotundus]|uniref:extracellular glycoprotein lacritin isoform X1 n=1 Tax=Desmodus rotundus TaxID=9430 RepID=UPI000D185335|nr:extracellular glycoprotein lacritin isoform X1 [Desmodus rotundus]
MRFMALLLLAALFGALVCAQDTTDNIPDATTEDSLTSELETTAPAESTSLQETAAAAQKTAGTTQAPATDTVQEQEPNPLKSMIEKSILLTQKAFDGAEKRANKGIQGGQKLIKDGVDFVQRLRNNFLDPKKFLLLGV